MEKDSNHAGPFVRLKVADAGGRYFSIFVPRGRSNKGGWRKMATLLSEMGGSNKDRDLENKRFDDRGGEESRKKIVPRGGKTVDSRHSFAEILKQSPVMDKQAIVEIDKKDCARVLKRLE